MILCAENCFVADHQRHPNTKALRYTGFCATGPASTLSPVGHKTLEVLGAKLSGRQNFVTSQEFLPRSRRTVFCAFQMGRLLWWRSGGGWVREAREEGERKRAFSMAPVPGHRYERWRGLRRMAFARTPCCAPRRAKPTPVAFARTPAAHQAEPSPHRWPLGAQAGRRRATGGV